MVNFIRETLEEKIVNGLPGKVIPVEIPESLDNYKLSHPIGSYLLIYNKSVYTRKKVQNIIAQDRDMEIMVVAACRYRNDFTPLEYVDFAIKSLSGLELENNRTDRKVYCISDEFLKEENGVWWYAINFIIPGEFTEQRN